MNLSSNAWEVCEKMVLRRIFGSKKYEVRQENGGTS
jgi:hypothetical protein